MNLNVASIRQRSNSLELYITELERHQTATMQELKADQTRRLAVERAFQVAVEICIDVASHIVSTYRLGQPEEQRELFSLLASAGYLDREFAITMSNLVDFRNWLVHDYWDVSAERLHPRLQEELVHLRRFRDFALQLVAAEDARSGG